MYLPSLLVIQFYPKAFIELLSLSGIFVAIICGIIPVGMVWVNRYHLNYKKIMVPGGKLMLVVTTIFFYLYYFAAVMEYFCIVISLNKLFLRHCCNFTKV